MNDKTQLTEDINLLDNLAGLYAGTRAEHVKLQVAITRLKALVASVDMPTPAPADDKKSE